MRESPDADKRSDDIDPLPLEGKSLEVKTHRERQNIMVYGKGGLLEIAPPP